MIELNFLGGCLIADYPKTLLPRVKPEWFTGWHKALVKTMQDMYQSSTPIGLHTLYSNFKDHASELAKLSNAYIGDAGIEKELFILEAQYNKNRLIDGITQIESKWDLFEIQHHLEQIMHESRIQQRNAVQSIEKVLNDKVDELEVRISQGNTLKGFSTGWKLLDKYIGGWNKGNLVIVGGRPGMGKSALGLNFCVDGSPFAKYCFVSIEMSADELAERIIAEVSNIENYKIRNAKINMEDLERINSQINNVHNFHIIDTKDNNVFNILSLLRIHKVKYGLDVVVVDYLQKLDAGGKDVRTNVSIASTTLKNFARELGITVIALAQLNRDGKNNRPELTELKESGQIEQDADVVLFPFRPAYYEDIKPPVEEAVVIIAKNRHGQCADILCDFVGSQTRYKEIINPF
jgi:replicative DNA helicase